MIWLIGLVVVLAVAFTDVLTIRTIARQHKPIWRRATVLLLSVGVPVGIWLAMFYRYAWSDHFEVLGFPIPVLVFQLEDGRWVDYVGNPLLAFVSLFLVASAFLLPVSLGLLLDWLRRQRMRISAKNKTVPS